VIPIPGTSNPGRLEENVRATEVQLTAAELERINAIVPQGVAAGSRYNEAMATLLNG
jgi:aryl-alcohol dehydrogenase-like predicted oxidoreductase